jgi:hypothetical protein
MEALFSYVADEIEQETKSNKPESYYYCTSLQFLADTIQGTVSAKADTEISNEPFKQATYSNELVLSPGTKSVHSISPASLSIQTQSREVSSETETLVLNSFANDSKAVGNLNSITINTVKKEIQTLKSDIFVLGAFVGFAVNAIAMSVYRLVKNGRARATWSYATDIGVHSLRKYLSFQHAQLSHVRTGMTIGNLN